MLFRSLFDKNPDELKRVERLKSLSPTQIKLTQKVSPLAAIIAAFLMSRTESVFHVYSDGSFNCFDPEDKNEVVDWERSHISIALSSVMQKYLNRDVDLTNKFTLGALSKDELTTLHFLRAGGLKSLTVHFDTKNVIQLIETKEEKVVNVESRFLEHILKNGYQSITFKTQAGKITTFERTTKHKIKR